MNELESLLCEAFTSFLANPTEIGTTGLDDTQTKDHLPQYLHEYINDLFATKIAGSDHFLGIKSSFRKVHNYKYLTDPTFPAALKKELSAQGIPKNTIDEMDEIIGNIIEELKKEDLDEQGSGWNQNIKQFNENDEIKD